jgi:hypothetical protein
VRGQVDERACGLERLGLRVASSTTSGLSSLDSAVVSRSTMPSHCWRSNSTVTPGWAVSNSAIADWTTSSGMSSPFSQSRSVAASSLGASVAAA